MEIVQIAHNAVNARLYKASRQARLEVSSALSYRVKGAEFTDAFKKNNWDGRSTFFDFRNDTFPAGFVNHVHAHLSARGYTVQLVRKPFPAPLGPVNPKVDDFPDDPRYDYQRESVSALLKHGQMIAQVATGGGKSRIARLAYAQIKRPTLFITTRSVLMYQMKDSFEQNMGIKVGVMGDSEWSPNKGFNVAMVQTLAARIENKTYESEMDRILLARKKNLEDSVLELTTALKRKRKPMNFIMREISALTARTEKSYPSDEWLVADIKKRVDEHQARRSKVLKLLTLFELAILEEAHESSSNSYYDVMRACTNAHYRLSLTGTPFMKDDEESNMRLMACSGSIGIRVSEKMLIDRGILAKPYFRYVALPAPSNVRRIDHWQNAYKKGIVENLYRNRHIAYESKRMSKIGMPVMILVQQVNHGKILKDLLIKETGLRVEYISGASNQLQRQRQLNRLGSGDIDVLIGTTILDVGVDVPAVGCIILAGGGKAETGLRQRVGRGLRAKKNGPNVAFIIDFTDGFNSSLQEHAFTRRAIIESTPGFVENIIPDGADFDFAGLGLAA